MSRKEVKSNSLSITRNMHMHINNLNINNQNPDKNDISKNNSSSFNNANFIRKQSYHPSYKLVRKFSTTKKHSIVFPGNIMLNSTNNNNKDIDYNTIKRVSFSNNPNTMLNNYLLHKSSTIKLNEDNEFHNTLNSNYQRKKTSGYFNNISIKDIQQGEKKFHLDTKNHINHLNNKSDMIEENTNESNIETDNLYNKKDDKVKKEDMKTSMRKLKTLSMNIFSYKDDFIEDNEEMKEDNEEDEFEEGCDYNKAVNMRLRSQNTYGNNTLHSQSNEYTQTRENKMGSFNNNTYNTHNTLNTLHSIQEVSNNNTNNIENDVNYNNVDNNINIETNDAETLVNLKELIINYLKAKILKDTSMIFDNNSKDKKNKNKKVDFSEHNIKLNQDLIISKYKELSHNFSSNSHKKSNNTVINKLYEVQLIDLGEKDVYVIKQSPDGAFLALGGESGVIKILQINGLEFFLNKIYEEYYLKDFNDFLKNNSEEGNFSNRSDKSEKSFDYKDFFENVNNELMKVFDDRVYAEFSVHDNEIIDLCWSVYNPCYILSAGCDNVVCLVDIIDEGLIRTYEHKGIVTGVAFLESTMDEYFITCALDKLIRIWKINSSECSNYINVQDYITCLSVFPFGEQIIIGSQLGKCLVYDLSYDNKANKINVSFSHSFEFSSNSQKEKITGIEFFNTELALVSSNDSIVRIVLPNKGIAKQEFLGAINKSSLIKASYDDRSNSIISASDDSRVVLWKYNLQDLLPGANLNINSIEQLNNNSANTNNSIFGNNHSSDIGMNMIINNSSIPRTKIKFNCEEYEFFYAKNTSIIEKSFFDRFKAEEGNDRLHENFESYLSVFLKGESFNEYYNKISLFNFNFSLNQVVLNCLSSGKLQVLVNLKFRSDNKRMIRKVDIYGD